MGKVSKADYDPNSFGCLCEQAVYSSLTAEQHFLG